MKISPRLYSTLLFLLVLCSVNGQINGYETLPKEPLFKPDPPRSVIPNHNNYNRNQNVIGSTKLDLRNGFKIFSFGDNISKYAGKISTKEVEEFGSKKILPIPSNEPYYNYTESEPSELFNVKWEKVVLGFSRKQLTKINVFWDTYEGDNGFKRIFNGIKQIYGEPNITDVSFGTYHTWEGDNVTMILHLTKSEYSDEGMESYSLKIRADELFKLINRPDKQF
tara:strand:- start:305 stop:973 length:669 start_codon:yes stop_codon:yes gene_type:complete